MIPIKILHIEPTSCCNLRCFHCAIRQPDYAAHVMPWETFEPLVKLAEKYRPAVLLNGHGECLTHPEYPRMFAAMAAAGCQIEFQSNATLLHEKVSEKFLSSGKWSRLTVSIDGIGEHYERIRGVPWDVTRKNISDFVKLRGDSDRPHLAVEYVAMKNNIAQMPEVAKFCAEIRAGTMLISDLIEYDATIGESISGKGIEETAEHWNEARRILSDDGIGMEVSGIVAETLGWDSGRFSANTAQVGRKICRVPFTAAYIRANGDVFPCCRLTNKMQPVGNINEQPLEQIWEGKNWSNFRLLMGCGQLDLCDGCTRVETNK